jgi:carbon monoxide dehydrogenase subunit G
VQRRRAEGDAGREQYEHDTSHAKSVPRRILRVVRAELTVEIARTPEDVFDYLTDVSNLPKWQSGVHEAVREGSQIHESRHMLGRELHTTLEIEEEERPRLFTLSATNSPVPFTVRHELAPNGAGTLLTVVGEGDAGMLPGFAAGIMARRAEKQFRKDFERLKKLLES